MYVLKNDQNVAILNTFAILQNFRTWLPHLGYDCVLSNSAGTKFRNPFYNFLLRYNKIENHKI